MAKAFAPKEEYPSIQINPSAPKNEDPFVKPELGEMANNYASGSGLYHVKQRNTINQPMFFSKCMIYEDINNERRKDVELSRHDDKHESLNNQQDSLTMGQLM
ncbi:unnamed protein product [Lupinus luteus]|uniref:Uncharacterized protein n=1 Tax=Lupinus luteus TaxID=3873 RepID=A0AAV1XI56_LUPLU